MFILTFSPSSRIPTPVAVLISAAVFALAHFTPGEFPQLFVLGNVDQLQVLLKLWFYLTLSTCDLKYHLKLSVIT